MNCTYCKNQINILNSYVLNEGRLCKNCYSVLPKGYDTQSYNDVKTKMVIDYIEQCKIKYKYDVTSSYGSLSIDENHGTFSLRGNNKKEVVLYSLDIEDFGITCSNIRTNKDNQVFCDVEFKVDFRYPAMSISQIIKKNIKCNSKRVNHNQLEWAEPGELSMFRNLFIQMIMNAEQKEYGNKLLKILHVPYEVELLKAKSLFMIGEYYDKEELKSKRKALMKAFHPDEGANTKDAQTINETYNRLLNELEE